MIHWAIRSSGKRQRPQGLWRFRFWACLRWDPINLSLGIELDLEAVQDDSVSYSGVIAGVSYLEGHQPAVGCDYGI